MLVPPGIIKLQRLQNMVFRTIGYFLSRTPVREMQMAFHLLYVYDYMTELCRQQAEVILNHDNENVMQQLSINLLYTY
jgi:hypothetical protein